MKQRRKKPKKTLAQMQPQAPPGTVTIVRLARGGHGVGYLGGLAVFVPRTTPGDVVDIRLVESRRRYAFAEVITLRHPSPWRATPPCPLYDRCGGCHLQHMRYSRQLDSKTAQIRDCMERIGKLPEVPVAATKGSPKAYAYRNKVLYHYDHHTKALGLIERGGERVVDIPRCLISDPRADAVMHGVRALTVVQPALHQVLRQVQVQVGQRTAEVLVTVIVSAALPTAVQRQLWDRLHDLATGLWMHVKTQDTPAVFHGSSTLIAGAHAIHERLGSQLLSIEPQTFLQVNPLQMERLYALVREFAALQGHEVILDLYSGAGAIALQLAAHCAQVYAVEVNRQASLLAMQQARVQGVENCQFRTGKVERILYRYMAQGLHADLAILDPPRAGCRPEALRALTLMGVPRLIYISCSPPTLARDLRLLHDLGYRTAGIYPFDMFPQTYHIECVATLDRVV